MMQYKGYVGTVSYDGEAKVLHGEVLGIRDVVTFQAESAADVEKEFRASVDDYLAFCRERGEEPDKPMSGQFVARVGPELHKKLSTIAAATGKSLNAVVTELLAEGTAAVMAGADVSVGMGYGTKPRRATAARPGKPKRTGASSKK